MGFKAETLVGQWSSNWGRSDVTVTGANLAGTWDEGEFSGTIGEDGVVALVWKHRDGTLGKATLRADAEGNVLDGTWGFGEDDKGGGAWTLRMEERPVAPVTAGDAPAGDAPAGGDGGEAPAPEGDGKKKKKNG